MNTVCSALQIRHRPVHDGGGGGLHGGTDCAGGAAAEGDVAAVGDVPGRRRHQVHPVDAALNEYDPVKKVI